MPNTDRRWGFREVDVGIQKNSDVFVASFQGYGESSAAILKRKWKEQVRLSLSNLHQPEGNKLMKSSKSNSLLSPSGKWSWISRVSS